MMRKMLLKQFPENQFEHEWKINGNEKSFRDVKEDLISKKLVGTNCNAFQIGFSESVSKESFGVFTAFPPSYGI